MSKKIALLASMALFAFVATAHAAEPTPAPAPAPQEKKEEKKTDKAPEKKDDAKGAAPAGDKH